MNKPVLTTIDVAEMLQCAPETVESHARAGTLLGVKIGVSWVFPAEALLESVNNMARQRLSERTEKPKAKAVQIPKQVKQSARPCLVGL